MSLKLVARDYEILKGYSTNVYLKNDKEYIPCEKVEFSTKGAVSVDPNGFVVGLEKGKGKVIAKYNNEEVSKTINVVEEKKILYIGHRGARPLSEEEMCIPNTKSGFETGAKRNTYGIETDIRMSPDHVVYCHHDGTFTLTPMNFEEKELKKNKLEVDSDINLVDFSVLKKLHIYWNNGSRHDVTKIALLVDYLRLCKKYKKKSVMEFKWTNGLNDNDVSFVDEIVDIVKKEEMYENMFFMTSMKKVLERIREKNKDAAMQLLTGVKTTNQESVDWCLENQASLDAYYQSLTLNQIRTIHNAHLYVNAWTVNQRADADILISMGVDMITSDLLQGEEK